MNNNNNQMMPPPPTGLLNSEGHAAGILSPENLAHHGTASSLNYKDWDFNDVAGWLEEHLKLPQYRDVFGKLTAIIK
jgi:hypothetical protein